MGHLVWRCLPFSGSRQSQGKCCFRQLVVQVYISHLVAFSFSHKLLPLVCGSVHHKPVLSCKVLSLLKIVRPLGFWAELPGLGYLVLDLMRHAFLESIIKGDAVALFLWPQGKHHLRSPACYGLLCPTAGCARTTVAAHSCCGLGPISRLPVLPPQPHPFCWTTPVCTARSLHGNVQGWQLGEVSEQQPFNPSDTSAHVKEEGCISVHTSFKSQGEEQDDRARL